LNYILTMTRCIIIRHFFHLSEGEYEEAAQMYLKAFKIDNMLAEKLEEYREAVKLYGVKGIFKGFLEFNLKKEPINSYRVAVDYYVLGEYERSLDWFERALEDRSFRMIQVKQGPLFSDPLFRSNPRFQAILKKMNFPDN